MSSNAQFTADDYRYMAKAIALAKRGWYSCRPNPRVGCVLVKNGRIVGQGAHLRAGSPHAEVVALAEAGAQASGATCYVTLEPCSHFGKTPPCIQALISGKVKRIYFSSTDPNPQLSGDGLDLLKSAGIETAGGLMADAAHELNTGYFKRMTTGLPRVRVKIAMSMDAKTALESGASKWITGRQARADVQRLRAESGAVVTGIGTVLVDNPALTVRDDRFSIPAPPIRAVVDSRLRIGSHNKLITDKLSTIIYTLSTDVNRIDELHASGKIVKTVASKGQRVDCTDVLKDLASLEVNDVLVEAGPRLTSHLIETRLVDELIIYIAPRILGAGARPALIVDGIEELSATPWLRIRDWRKIGVDFRVTANIVPHADGV